VSPDGADNIGLSTVANTATAPATKRGEHRQDERTAFEVRVCRRHSQACTDRLAPICYGYDRVATGADGWCYGQGMQLRCIATCWGMVSTL
jgi:hypothetical protein